MAMNSLEKLVHCLTSGAPRIELDAGVIRGARTCIDRMLEFVAQRPNVTAPPASGFVPHLGAA
jgi:quinolinate synthase